MRHLFLIQKDDWSPDTLTMVHWPGELLQDWMPSGVHLSTDFSLFLFTLPWFSYLFFIWVGPTNSWRHLTDCGKIWDKAPIIWGQDHKWIELFWAWWNWQFCTFSTFSGLVAMLSADRTYLRNTTLNWKKWHFFGLIFKWKSFSLLNTISIWPNNFINIGCEDAYIIKVQQQGDKLLVS